MLMHAVTALIKINNSKANHNKLPARQSTFMAVIALVKINNLKVNNNSKTEFLLFKIVIKIECH